MADGAERIKGKKSRKIKNLTVCGSSMFHHANSDSVSVADFDLEDIGNRYTHLDIQRI